MSAPTTCTYIAVVDDEESLCHSMARLLRAFGMTPVTYLSAEDFLNDAKRPRFDCLIFDIQLNGMSGIELSERLNESGSSTPVIFMTALENPEMRERALETHCAAYLRKSDPAEVMLAAIDRAIHSYDTRNLAP